MRASLSNVDDLERRLGLPAKMAERKRRQIRTEFIRLALLECDTRPARSLLRRIFR